MKKLFTLIAVALCTLGASAVEYTDVASRTDAVYAEATTLKAGDTCVPVAFWLKSAGNVQTLGITAITLPAGAKFVTFYDEDEDDNFYATLIKGNTTASKHSVSPALIKENELRIGINTVKGDCFKTDATKLFNLYVTIPSDMAAGDYAITLSGIEYSNNSATTPYTDTPVKGKLDVEDVVCKLTITGADAISNIAADGTEAAAPAKKVVDGQLVIETANGTFNAAGAQVK
jgi:hypothetical protein